MAYNDWLQRSSEMFSWLFALFHRPRKHARCPCLYAFRIWDFLLFYFSLINSRCFFCSFCLLYQINHCTIFMFSSFLCFCWMYYIKNNQNKSAQTTIPSASQGMAYGMRTFQTMKIIVCAFFLLSFLSLHWMKEEKLCHFR